MSGKTTLLSALVAFLPPDTRPIFLRGLSETFDYAREADPAHSYLLVNELSSHLPVYLWGAKATRMFQTLQAGFGLGTTMHADDVAGVLEQLSTELSLGTTELARLDVIGIMRTLRGDIPILGHDDVPPEMRYGPAAIRRRLVALHLVRREGDRIVTPLLSQWDARTDEHRIDLESDLQALAARTGREVPDFCAELARRETFLAELAADGIRRPRAVGDAVAAYRGGER